MTKRIAALLAHVMTAVSNCALYSPDHPSVSELAEKAAALIDDLFTDDAFTLAIYGMDLFANDTMLEIEGLHMHAFVKKMKRKGCEKLVFTRGLDAEELRRFIIEMAAGDTIQGQYPHITHGILEVKLGGGGMSDPAAITAANVAQVKDVYQGVSRFKRLDMVGLEDVVVSFIATLRQEANVLRMVSPIKAYSEYTYTHNTNVAILSIFQAEILGVPRDLLHDIGLSGLLHDIGKLFVHADVLDKPGPLNDREWVLMRNHTNYGALYLAKLSDVPPVSVISAFEHHMKFDGTGYPDTRRRSRRQHIVSQIIAISDFFDALRTDRPYRKAQTIRNIAGMLREMSGRQFNPLLVDNFLAGLKRIQAI